MATNLSNLKSIKSTRATRRLGRGGGSSKGKTSGRGHKGYKSRTGSTARLRYEGGQNPIIARIPKLRGFKVVNEVKYSIYNVGDIELLAEKGVFSRKILNSKGLVKRGYKIKVLGNGEIKSAIKVEVNSYSASAKEKIEKAGGQAMIIKTNEKKKKYINRDKKIK